MSVKYAPDRYSQAMDTRKGDNPCNSFLSRKKSTRNSDTCWAPRKVPLVSQTR